MAGRFLQAWHRFQPPSIPSLLDNGLRDADEGGRPNTDWLHSTQGFGGTAAAKYNNIHENLVTRTLENTLRWSFWSVGIMPPLCTLYDVTRI